MSRTKRTLSDDELARLKPEGSFARIDAIKAAKRRVMQRRAPTPPADIDASMARIVVEKNSKDRAAFDALIAAIENACDCDSGLAVMMKLVAKAAVKKAYPQFAEDAVPLAPAEGLS